MNATGNDEHVELTLDAACSLVRSSVQREFRLEVGAAMHLFPIERDALEQARAWRRKYQLLKMHEREPGWDWKHEFYTRGKRSTHVDLAIWSDTALCGLMIGQVSDGRINATIHFLESDPGENPLKGYIVSIATRFIEALGLLLGCEAAVISRPIPELVDFYRGFGYTIEKRRQKTVVALAKRLPDSPNVNGREDGRAP